LLRTWAISAGSCSATAVMCLQCTPPAVIAAAAADLPPSDSYAKLHHPYFFAAAHQHANLLVPLHNILRRQHPRDQVSGGAEMLAADGTPIAELAV